MPAAKVQARSSATLAAASSSRSPGSRPDRTAVEERRLHGQEARLVLVAAQAQQVGAGDDGLDGGLRDAVLLADRAHLQAVGDDDAGEAELAAQQVGLGAVGQGRRQVASQLRDCAGDSA